MPLAEDIISIEKDRQILFIAEIIHALTIDGRYAYSPRGAHSVGECGKIIEDIHRASGYLIALLADDLVFDDLSAQLLASIIERLPKGLRTRLCGRFALASGA